VEYHNEGRLGYLPPLLPFVEQQPLWEKISNPMVITGWPTAPAMGPITWRGYYPPWRAMVGTFRCPSDPSESQESNDGFGLGTTNYAACTGDDMTEAHWDRQETDRGCFEAFKYIGLNKILDGTSNTIMLGEICGSIGTMEKRTTFANQNPRSFAGDPWGVCLNNPAYVDANRPQYYIANAFIGHADAAGQGATRGGRGARWASGDTASTMCHAIGPPNSASCAGDGPQWGGDARPGIFSMGSRHQGGCHVAMADGAVKFISENIETGFLKDTSANPMASNGAFRNAQPGPYPANYWSANLNPPGSESPYGLWGALGTRNGKENKSL
jgi:prepilin-type processing-associated H-X9-DG protein